MYIDETDRKILRVLQADSSKSLQHIAKKVAISKTALWNRIQRMQAEKVIQKQTILVDAHKVGFQETFFVMIKTSQHDDNWLTQFFNAVKNMPEIMEAHRLAGEMDYILKVNVTSTRAYDEFYKRLISQVGMNSVTACLSMETLKYETTIPV